jgi:hypothetical protein
MVASVEISRDKKVYRVWLSDKTVSGVITETGTEDNGDYVVIGEEKYILAYDIPQNITISQNGEFLINAFGQISNIAGRSKSGYTYAYVIDTARKNSLGGEYTVQILDGDGLVKVKTLSDRVILDGMSADAGEVFSKTAKASLIQYKADGENTEKIREVKIAVDNGKNVDYAGYDEALFSLDKEDSLYYKKTAIPGFGNIYLAPPDTLVFNIPPQSDDLDSYSVTDNGIFLADVYYRVKIYDADKRKCAAVIVNGGIDTTMSREETIPWNGAAFVVNTAKTVWENGESAYVLEGWQNGEITRVKPARTNNTVGKGDDFDALGDVVLENPTNAASLKFTDLKQGYVIQYKVDAKGAVDAFRVIYRPGASTEIRKWNGSDNNVNLLTAVAVASYADSEVLRVTVDGDKNTADYSRTFALSNVNIYKYDSKKSKVEKAEIPDILSTGGASKIFVRAYRDTAGDIIILE